MCRERDSNPHSHHWPRDFKSLVSTNSTITAKSGKRDSDPRPQPWQGCALPTELFPLEIKLKIPKDADSSPSYFAPAKLILINETTKQNNIFFIFGMVLALRNANQFWLVYCRENARESRFGNRRGKIREYFACWRNRLTVSLLTRNISVSRGKWIC